MNYRFDLTICIVNWNAGEYLERCLASIQKNIADLSYEVIVVDNASTDDSVNRIKKKFPDYKIIQNTENKGFAAANNQAFEQAAGKWVFLLNPDAEIKPHCVEKLIHYLSEHSDVAIAAPKLLNSDGSVQKSLRRFPNFKTALYRYTFVKKLGLFSNEESLNKMEGCDFDQIQSVEQPAGAALMIRHELLDKVGGLDSNFFLFYEEVDLCYRLRKRGYDIVYLPEAECVHHSGKSRQKNRKNIFLPTIKSMFYYFTKHYGEARTRRFKWLFKPLFVFSTVWDVVEEFFSFLIYRVKKESYKAERKRQLYTLKAAFLKENLMEFLFRV